MRRRIITFWNIFAVVLLLFVAGMAGYARIAPQADAYAGANVIGQRSGADMRALVTVNGSDRVWRIVYFSSGSHPTGGANTPVVSDQYCDLPGTLHFAKMVLTGTMAGTNPTLTLLWENSKDDGATWDAVGSWTVVNATVTPASQSQTVADIAASTAVIFGECWRFKYTMAGTGPVAANFIVTGLEK